MRTDGALLHVHILSKLAVGVVQALTNNFASATTNGFHANLDGGHCWVEIASVGQSAYPAAASDDDDPDDTDTTPLEPPTDAPDDRDASPLEPPTDAPLDTCRDPLDPDDDAPLLERLGKVYMRQKAFDRALCVYRVLDHVGMPLEKALRDTDDLAAQQIDIHFDAGAAHVRRIELGRILDAFDDDVHPRGDAGSA